MKKLKLGLLAFIVTGFVACSSDDDGTSNPDPQPSTSNYFPLKTGNSWTYNNNSKVNNENPTESEEILNVENTIEGEGNLKFNLETDKPIEGGFSTGVLSKSDLFKTNSELVADGIISFEFQGLPALEIPIENAVIYDHNKNAGEQLFTTSSSITQQYQGVDLVVDYTITTGQEASYAEYEVNGTTYENVISSSVIINANVSAKLGPVDITVLEEQNVANSTNFFAKDIGLIYSETSLDYQFEDLSNFGFQLPENFSIEETQTILSYNVDLEE